MNIDLIQDFWLEKHEKIIRKLIRSMVNHNYSPNQIKDFDNLFKEKQFSEEFDKKLTKLVFEYLDGPDCGNINLYCLIVIGLEKTTKMIFHNFKILFKHDYSIVDK